jgi:hypothetical protein
MMKRIVFFVAFFVLAGFSLQVTYACGVNDRFAFNLGNRPYAVQTKNGQGGIVINKDGQRYQINVKLSENFTVTISIPSVKVSYKGIYAPADRCLTSPNIIEHWEDERQQLALDLIKDEVRWLAYHSEFRIYEQGFLRVYIPLEAFEVFKKRGFIFNERELKLQFPNNRVAYFKGNNSANTVVLVNYDPEKDRIIFNVTEVSGKEIDYVLEKNGEFKELKLSDY